MGPKPEELLVQAVMTQKMTEEILAVVDKYKGQKDIKLIMGSPWHSRCTTPYPATRTENG